MTTLVHHDSHRIIFSLACEIYNTCCLSLKHGRRFEPQTRSRDYVAGPLLLRCVSFISQTDSCSRGRNSSPFTQPRLPHIVLWSLAKFSTGVPNGMPLRQALSMVSQIWVLCTMFCALAAMYIQCLNNLASFR